MYLSDFFGQPMEAFGFGRQKAAQMADMEARRRAKLAHERRKLEMQRQHERQRRNGYGNIPVTYNPWTGEYVYDDSPYYYDDEIDESPSTTPRDDSYRVENQGYDSSREPSPSTDIPIEIVASSEKRNMDASEGESLTEEEMEDQEEEEKIELDEETMNGRITLFQAHFRGYLIRRAEIIKYLKLIQSVLNSVEELGTPDAFVPPTKEQKDFNRLCRVNNVSPAFLVMEEGMMRKMISLDEIPSTHDLVREARRAAVRNIQWQLNELDEFKNEAMLASEDVD